MVYTLCCALPVLQVNIVGKAQTSYLPGVLVPEINAGGVAELAGFQPGDIILRVGDYTVPANPSQVSRRAVELLQFKTIASCTPSALLSFAPQPGEQMRFSGETCMCVVSCE
jgi:hypothetical protein